MNIENKKIGNLKMRKIICNNYYIIKIFFPRYTKKITVNKNGIVKEENINIKTKSEYEKKWILNPIINKHSLGSYLRNKRSRK